MSAMLNSGFIVKVMYLIALITVQLIITVILPLHTSLPFILMRKSGDAVSQTHFVAHLSFISQHIKHCRLVVSYLSSQLLPTCSIRPQ